MTVKDKRQGYSLKGIGVRLTLILIGVMGFYLLTTWHSIRALQEQSQGFSVLSGSHFERTMHAAELSRDAEVIAAQALESLMGARRTASDIPPIDQDLLRIYQNVRNEIEPASELERLQLAELDRWQKPYFDSLKKLSDKLSEEQSFQLRQQEKLNDLLTRLKSMEQGLVSPEAIDPVFNAYSLAALSYASLALSSERAGQLRRLELSAHKILGYLKNLPSLSPFQQQYLSQLTPVVSDAFEFRRPVLVSQRASLAAVRQARLYAQKLTTSSYNYFLTLKKTAMDATETYQQLVSETFRMIAIFSVIFVLLLVLTVLFIREKVVRRLDELQQVMHLHVEGKRPEIPMDGDDEISAMGRAFSVFVEARRKAEQELIEARQEAEDANQQLKTLNSQLQMLSETDTLTQIPNRRRFEQELQTLWRHCTRYSRPLCLIIMDIDNFKLFNDRYGHHAGDHCLYHVAQLLLQEMEACQGMLARYGGEEFVVLLPEMDSIQGRRVAEQLLSAVRAAELKHLGSPEGIVTLSIGIASCLPESGTVPYRLLQRADEALYRAKNAGRARVEVA